MQSLKDLSTSSKNEFYSIISNRNLIVEILFLTLLCVYELYTIGSFLVNPELNELHIPNRIFFLIHISFLAFYMIILSLCLIFKKTFASKPRRINNLTFILCFFICLWSIFITLISYSEITFYVATILTMSFVVTLTPKKSFSLFLLINFIFVTLFYIFKYYDFIHKDMAFNSTLVIILTMVISYVNYQNRIREFIQLHTIKEQNKNLQLMIMKDGLTNLYNRRCFDKTIKSLLHVCILKKSKLSVLMLDIDNFKAYNDSLGHQAGDNCLIEVSKIIKKAAAENSGLAFRYGGEEFTMLFTGLNKDEIMAKAEAVRKEVENLNYPYNSDKCNITISTGIFHVLPNEDTNFDHCIKVADTLLYKVKELGKNNILIEEEFN